MLSLLSYNKYSREIEDENREVTIKFGSMEGFDIRQMLQWNWLVNAENFGTLVMEYVFLKKETIMNLSSVLRVKGNMERSKTEVFIDLLTARFS